MEEYLDMLRRMAEKDKQSKKHAEDEDQFSDGFRIR
jgi:hypothetical protein